MNYILYTPSAARLKKEILDKVSEKIDANLLLCRQDNNRISLTVARHYIYKKIVMSEGGLLLS